MVLMFDILICSLYAELQEKCSSLESKFMCGSWISKYIAGVFIDVAGCAAVLRDKQL